MGRVIAILTLSFDKSEEQRIMHLTSLGLKGVRNKQNQRPSHIDIEFKMDTPLSERDEYYVKRFLHMDIPNTLKYTGKPFMDCITVTPEWADILARPTKG